MSLFVATCYVDGKQKNPDPILFEGKITSVNSQTMIGFYPTINETKTITITHCLGYDILTPGSKTSQYIPQCDCNYVQIFENLRVCSSKANVGDSIAFAKYFRKDGDDPYFSYDMEKYESKRALLLFTEIMFFYIPCFIAGIAFLVILASKWIDGLLVKQFPWYQRECVSNDN